MYFIMEGSYAASVNRAWQESQDTTKYRLFSPPLSFWPLLSCIYFCKNLPTINMYAITAPTGVIACFLKLGLTTQYRGLSMKEVWMPKYDILLLISAYIIKAFWCLNIDGISVGIQTPGPLPSSKLKGPQYRHSSWIVQAAVLCSTSYSHRLLQAEIPVTGHIEVSRGVCVNNGGDMEVLRCP